MGFPVRSILLILQMSSGTALILLKPAFRLSSGTSPMAPGIAADRNDLETQFSEFSGDFAQLNQLPLAMHSPKAAVETYDGIMPLQDLMQLDLSTAVFVPQ